MSICTRLRRRSKSFLSSVACNFPVTAYQCADGRVVFVENLARNSVVRSLQLPCRRCVGCRLEHSRQWAVRCMHEASLFERNCFLTLTYADPAPLSLELDHIQRFWKRWRARGVALRYYAAGEYTTFNEETRSPGGRPHWHACVFGADFDDKSVIGKSPSGERLYRSAVLESLWPYGFSSVGDVSFESAAYVARYCMKKLTGDGERDYYEIFDPETGEIFPRRKEFSMMSKGIGRDWMRLYWQDVKRGKVVARGHECPVPRYYMKMMRKLGVSEEVDQERYEYARAHFADSSPERLAVREEVMKARVGLLKRGKV